MRALWYGLLPWWAYEAECHYAGMSYLAHLVLNLRLAARWLAGLHTWGDVRSEVVINGGGRRR